MKLILSLTYGFEQEMFHADFTDITHQKLRCIEFVFPKDFFSLHLILQEQWPVQKEFLKGC